MSNLLDLVFMFAFLDIDREKFHMMLFRSSSLSCGIHEVDLELTGEDSSTSSGGDREGD